MAKGQSPLCHSNSFSKTHLPRNRNRDSPSQQLHVELEETFAQLQLHESERQKLHAFNRKSVQDDLDARELAQAVAHNTEIDNAIAKHEIVRQEAIAVLEAHVREEEEERRRWEEEDRRRREEEARRKAEEQQRIREEKERRAQEQKQKAEAARRAAAERAKAEEEERGRREREATAEKERQTRVQAEAEARATSAKEEAAKAAAAKSLPVPKQSTSIPNQEPPWSAHPEIRHRHYLEIHQRLKTFRMEFWKNSRTDPQLKPFAGDMRRVLKTSINQLSFHDKKSNLAATQRAKQTLLQALNEIRSPPVIVNDFLPPHLGLLDKNTTTVPSLVVYLLSIFSKAIVTGFATECGTNSEAAEPLGTIVAQLFSMPQLQFQRNAPSIGSGAHYSAFGGTAPTPPLEPNSVSLISILISKLHATAPMLFGVSASEKTTAGRLKLGWRRKFQKEGDAEKSFIPEAQQHERVSGLGAGYASIALRNFSKTSLTNPYPPYHFWESLSFITNTNPAEIQLSHLYLLKFMLVDSLQRFLLFFGDEGIAALRKAFIDLPKRLPLEMKKHNGGLGVIYLADTWKTEKNFHLE